MPPDKNKLGGSFFSWGFYNGAKCVYVPQGADIDNIYIYVYNLTPTRASENSSCGIQVYNAEGQVVYDSNEKYMNVIIANISGWGGHTITAEDLKEWPNVAISMPFMEMVTPKQVAPVRERGLKCLCNAYSAAGRCRSRKGAWIEITHGN